MKLKILKVNKILLKELSILIKFKILKPLLVKSEDKNKFASISKIRKEKNKLLILFLKKKRY